MNTQRDGRGGARHGAGRPKGKKYLAGSPTPPTSATTSPLTTMPAVNAERLHDMNDSTFVYHVKARTLREMPEFRTQIDGWWEFLIDCDEANNEADFRELALKYAALFAEMHPQETVLQGMDSLRESLLNALRRRHDYCLKNHIGRFGFLGRGIKCPTLDDVHFAGIRLAMTVSLPCLQELMSQREKLVADDYVRTLSFVETAKNLNLSALVVRRAWLNLKRHAQVINARHRSNPNSQEYASLRELELSIIPDDSFEDDSAELARARDFADGAEIYKHSLRRGLTFERSRAKLETNGGYGATKKGLEEDDTDGDQTMHEDYGEDSKA